MLRLLLFLLFLSTNSLAVKLLIDPTKIEIEGYPGTTKGFSFTITNGGEISADMKLYPQDIDITPEGEILYLAAGSATYSCSPWIRLSQERFVLKPKERKTVSGELVVPRDANGSYHALIFCEAVPPKPKLEEGEAGVAIHLRTPVYMEARIGRGIWERLKIHNIDFLNDKKQFRVVVENKGNDTVVTKEGMIEIKGRQYGFLKRLPLVSERYTLFPESLRIFKSELKEPLNKGSYEVKVEVGYKEKGRVITTRNFLVDKDGRITFLSEKQKEELEGISFEIEPAKISLSLPPYAFRTGIIRIKNGEAKPLLLSLELSNLSHNEDGEVQSLPPSSQTTYSILPFISVFPISLRLSPNGIGFIRYKIGVPRDEEGGKYGLISFSLITLDGKKDTFALPLELVILKTEKHQFGLTEVKRASPRGISFVIKNEGNILEKSRDANLYLKNPYKETICKTQFTFPTLFPGESRKIEIEEAKLPKTECILLIEIDGKIVAEKVF
ncbi:MAG: hypothetical protein QME07_04155 [bacterium]|nr:hypothetical protein [bacterium]